MSSTVSTVSSAASATPSSSSCSTADFTRFPTTDVFCAVGSTTGIPSNTSSVLSSCCKSAPVEQFNGQCGYYCLSYQQTVADLQKCFQAGGVNPATIFCSGNNTASASGKPTSTPSSSAKPSNNPTGSSGVVGPGSSSSPSGPAKTNAAASLVLAPQSVSKAGLGMLGMIVVSLFAGALL